MRSRYEKVGGQDLGDDRAHHRKCRVMRAAPLAFALKPGVGQGGEDDVALPPREGAALEVIEAEFVLQLLVLLLDRPPLMRQSHQGAERRGGRQVDEIVLGSIARAQAAFAEQPDLRGETTV